MILDCGASNLVWAPPAVSSRWDQPVLGMEWVNPSKREGLKVFKNILRLKCENHNQGQFYKLYIYICLNLREG